MLYKLAFRNAKRSMKDYLIYLITITMSFSLMFSFWLVSGSEAVIRLSRVMDSFRQIINFVDGVIIFVVCFLINYTTKFMLEKRSKEFGMYMLLGIHKKDITKMFLAENFLLGFFSLLLAIPLGFFMSQFLSIIIVGIFGLHDMIFIRLRADAAGLLGVYFIVIYILVLFNIFKKMSRMSVQHFLYLDKKNEQKMFAFKACKNFWKRRETCFVISVILGLAALGIWRARFCNIEVFGQEATIYYLEVSIILLIISIYGISVTGTDIILMFVLKKDRLKYQKDNLFLARTFSSKVRSMSLTFGTLSMLITLTLVALNISGMAKGMCNYLINSSAPYDFSAFEDEAAWKVQGIFDSYIQVIEEEYTIQDTFTFEVYKQPNMQVQNVVLARVPWAELEDEYDSVIKLSDYNTLLQLRGMKRVTLAEDEYMIITDETEKHWFENVQELRTITLSDKTVLKQKEVTTDGYWAFINMTYYLVVLPDQYTNGLETARSYLVVDTAEETKESLKNTIREKMAWYLCQTDEKGEVHNQYYKFQVRGSAIGSGNSTLVMISFVCIYIAFILISTVGTILAIQSLSDAAKYKYRYTVLRRLGVNDSALYHTIRKQLLILFGLPVFYPILSSFWIVDSINNVYHVFLTNKYEYLIYFFVGLVLFLFVYIVYFIATYVGFKRNINEA